MKIVISITEPFIVRSLLKGHLRWLVSKGHDVTVVCSPGHDTEWISKQGANFAIVNIERKPNIFKDFKCLFEMIMVLRRLRPDVIHYSTPKSSLITPLAMLMGLIKSRSVYTVRGRVYENMHGLKRWVFELADKFSCWKADFVIFISKEIKDDFINESLVNKKKAVIIGSGSSNGFDTNLFRKPTVAEKTEAKSYFGLESSSRVLAYVGRIALDKGVEDLFQVFKSLAHHKSLITFLIVGKVEVELEPLLRRYGIEPNQIVIYDWIPDIHKAFWAADVTLFPSFREGFGNICIESILCGTPVVCYDIVGCRESVKHEVSGYLVPFRDTQAMAEKAYYLLTNMESRDLMVEMGTKWAISAFDQKIIWNGILNIYEGLWFDTSCAK